MRNSLDGKKLRQSIPDTEDMKPPMNGLSRLSPSLVPSPSVLCLMEHRFDGSALGINLDRLMRFEVDIGCKDQPLLGHAAPLIFKAHPDGTDKPDVQEPRLGDDAPISHPLELAVNGQLHRSDRKLFDIVRGVLRSVLPGSSPFGHLFRYTKECCVFSHLTEDLHSGFQGREEQCTSHIPAVQKQPDAQFLKDRGNHPDQGFRCGELAPVAFIPHKPGQDRDNGSM